VAEGPTEDRRRVAPLDVDGVRTAVAGTVAWAVAFVVLLPFSRGLSDDGRGWWLWTCAAGVGLGLIAVLITVRRRSRLRAVGRPLDG
jgi:hypothetical protein